MERHNSKRLLRASSRTWRSLPGEVQARDDDVGVEGPLSRSGDGDFVPVLFHQAGHVLGSQALFPGPPFSIPEQLPPLTFLDVAEHRLPEELAPGATLLLHGLVYRLAMSGGREKVIVLVIRGMFDSYLPSLTGIMREGGEWVKGR